MTNFTPGLNVHRYILFQHRIPQNPQLWDLPEEIRNDATEWSYFASTLKELLTSVRGAMKQKVSGITELLLDSMTNPRRLVYYKIKKSHDQQEDIASLANGIGSRKGANMIIKRSHWARYAFLVRCRTFSIRNYSTLTTIPEAMLSRISRRPDLSQSSSEPSLR